MIRTQKSRQQHRRSGSSVLEMVLVFPILLYLAFGMIEFGQFFFIRHVFSAAVRDGARVAILPSTLLTRTITDAMDKTLVAGGLPGTSSSWLTMQQSTDGVNYVTCTTPTSLNHGDVINLTLQTTYDQLSAAFRPLSSATGNRVGLKTGKQLTCQATMIRE